MKNADMRKMSVLVRQASWRPVPPVQQPWIALLAYAMVVVVFIGDWVLPDSVVADIAYQAPVVFAALRGTQRLTGFTVALGCVGILLGWFVDLANASYHFSEIRIENRLLSLISLLIVGALAQLFLRHAKRARQLEDERALARSIEIASAIDRVMAPLSPEKAIRAVAGVALGLLEATVVVWCPARREGDFWVTREGTSEAKALLDVHPPEGFAELLQRVGSRHSVEVLSAADSIDHLAGKAPGSDVALAIPVGAAADFEGVVFAAVKGEHVDARALAIADNFARFATAAVQQARLVDRLERSANGPAATSAG